ncbi:MAG TPA: hypothetical protein V6D33_19390 [Cyanophyceae cyanobacterium]
MNADGTVTITGANGTVTAIAQTAFRSGTWSVKQVGNTWYAWSENSPITGSESRKQRRSRSEKKKESEGLTLLVSVTKSGQEYFYAVSDTHPLKEIAVLPISSAHAPAHLAATTARGKRKYLFSCIYESDPTNTTDNTGLDLFIGPVHYTIKTIGLQNWELNCYFDTSPLSSPLSYGGAGFWYQTTMLDPTTSSGFASYAYSTKTPEGVVLLVRSTVYATSLEYFISPSIKKTANPGEFIVSNLISPDQQSIFYTKSTLTTSIIIRMRATEELQVSKPSSMSLSSLYSCEYKNNIYNFNPQVGLFIFGSSVSVTAVKTYGIRVYNPTPGSGTINYQESASRLPINSLKGIDGLSSIGQLKIHSAFYG